MTQSDIINNNFSKAFECIKCSNAYNTGEVLSEEKLFKQISERKHSTFDLSKFTVVGSPTITDDGIVSGFSSANDISVGFPSISGNELIIEGVYSWNGLYPTSSSGVVTLLGDNRLTLFQAQDGRLEFYRIISNQSYYDFGRFNILANTPLKYIITLTLTSLNITCYQENTEIYNKTVTTNLPNISDFKSLRLSPFAEQTQGSSDLKQFSITVDGKEVFNGNKTGIDVINDIEIPYTLSKTGSKIVDVAYRDRVIDLYEQEGKAGYYTIDEENKNFTLPMGEIYGMIGGSSSTGGSGLEICDIGMALYVDETKGLRRYLNGQIVDRNTNTEAFFTRLQQIATLHPSLLCTEEEWQTAKTMSAFGQVGKFVFNYSGDKIVSVRLPRVVNIQGLFDLQNLGMTVGAGLPNITGHLDVNADRNIFNGGQWGAFYRDRSGGKTWAALEPNTPNSLGDIHFNASRSNPIYGNSNTVQQEAIQYPYFIQIATGQETEANIINEIELNNPYSLFDSKYSDHELNNLSWLKSEGQWNTKAVYTDAYDKLLKVYNGTETVEGLIVKLSTETYTDYDFVLNTADETFRLPLLDGSETLPTGELFNQTVPTINTNTFYQIDYNCFVTIHLENCTHCRLWDNTQNRETWTSGAAGYQGKTLFMPKGHQLGVYYQNGTMTMFTFQKAQGNGTLYYYVGETVQNANLIDAGRISEVIPNKLDKKQLYNKITNCLLEVPQRIKLELNDRVLTLKAGSKVIVPNGFEADGTTPKFDEVVIKSDVVRSNFSTKSDKEIFIHYVSNENSLSISTVSLARSGTTEPTSSSYIFYNTGTNYLYDQSGSNKSFPIAICTLTTSGVISINQVFNGMGYFGSTVWVDKGVKGLIPNGRNEDGSLKSIEYLNSEFKTYDNSNVVNTSRSFVLKQDGTFTRALSYKVNNDGYLVNSDGVYTDGFVCGDIVLGSNYITSFTPKLPFRAVDYNDKAEIASWSLPSTKYIDLTLGATGSTYTAPANGWVQAVCNSSSDSPAFIEVNTEYASSTGTRYKGCWGRATIPVTRGRTFTVYYGGADFEIKMFRFTYAEGEV